MEQIIDIDYVLRPISEPDPSPRSSRLQLRQRRDQEFENNEQYENHRLFGPEQEGIAAPDRPDWGKLSRDLQQHLANGSKDLWVCVWLVECLVAKDGFHGLAEGFELLYRICSECWEQIEPSPNDEGGVEYTLRMVCGFSKGDHFVDQINLAPITPALGQHEPASCGTIDDLESATRAELLGGADDEFAKDLHKNVLTALRFWGDLETLLEGLAGDGNLPFVRLREILESCQRTIMNAYPSLEAIEPEVPSGESALTVSDQSSQVASAAPVSSNGNHLTNREQAFRTLEALSNYFRENEPNSPVSLALLQAIRWGKMSFQELMEEVVDDQSTKESILRLAGFREPKDDD